MRFRIETVARELVAVILRISFAERGEPAGNRSCPNLRFNGNVVSWGTITAIGQQRLVSRSLLRFAQCSFCVETLQFAARWFMGSMSDV